MQVRLSTAKDRWQGYVAAVEALENQVANVQSRRDGLADRARTAEAALGERLAEARELSDKAAKLAAEAEAIENDALNKLSKARGSFAKAVRAAKADVQDASTKLSAATDRKNARLERMATDRGPEAAAEDGLAEVFILQAELHLQRFADALDQRSLLQQVLELVQMTDSAGSAEMSQALAAIDVKLSETRQAGLDSLDKADSNQDAAGHLALLKRALSGMRSKDAWVADARIGLVWYVASQLAGDEQARLEALAKAVAALDGALATGTEGELRTGDMARPFVELLTYLEPYRVEVEPAAEEPAATPG
jgi:hypothetical protein